MSRTAERVFDVVDSVVTLPDIAKNAPQEVVMKDLGIDSLDVVEIVTELEEEFDVTIPDDQIQKWETLANIIKYFEERTAA